MTDALQYASVLLPLYNRAVGEYIRFTELAAKALLDPGMVDLDFREFELATTRLGATLVELEAAARRVRETGERLTEGLESRA